MEFVVKGLQAPAVTAETTEATAETKKRSRPAKDKAAADPATAQAPAPVAIPATPAPELAAQVQAAAAAGGGIPPFLDRTAPAAPPAPPAPPPPPPAPAAPVAPPSGILAGKVIAELEKRKAGSEENAKMLVQWLAAPTIGLVVADSSFDDAIAAVRLMPDDKLSVAATALAVS
jgi:hypothetical protein